MPEIIVFNHLTGDQATVSLEHDGTVVDVVDDGWGGTIDVFLISDLKYINPSGYPMEFVASAPGKADVKLTLGANQDGERHIPTPQHFRHFPCTFRISRR